MKLYKLGLVTGRFQPLHNGHIRMINKALENCEKVIILIGSAQESGTERNPLSYNQREFFIKEAFTNDFNDKDRLIIAPIVDIGIGNAFPWGDYLMNTCKFIAGEYPDVIIAGSEPDRDGWFDTEKYPDVAFIKVNRNDVKISGTMVRESFKNGDRNWEYWVPYFLIELYKYSLFEVLK